MFDFVKRVSDNSYLATCSTTQEAHSALYFYYRRIFYSCSLMILIGFYSLHRNYPWKFWRREKLWFDNYRRNWETKRCRWFYSKKSDSRKSWLNKLRRPKYPSNLLRLVVGQVKIHIEGHLLSEPALAPKRLEAQARPQTRREPSKTVESKVSSLLIFPISNQSVW